MVIGKVYKLCFNACTSMDKKLAIDFKRWNLSDDWNGDIYAWSRKITLLAEKVNISRFYWEITVQKIRTNGMHV